ncbi:MAG: glutamine synthetase family protein [Chloroflexota bacterium]|nr:glutamine synthetase family protein [Chloroflexota bacterium]
MAAVVGERTGYAPELVEAALERAAREGVQLVDLQFSDIAGGARTMTIPADLLPPVLDHGYRFDGSAVTGGRRDVELDLYLVPDPSTMVVFPSADGAPRRGRFSCSVRRRDGQPFAGDPRSILERALAAADAAGFDYRVALEIEFYLLRQGEVEPARPDPAGYFGVGEGAIAGTRDEIVATLHAIGIDVGGAHHETGPGQEELDLWPVGALRMADQLLTVRPTIRAVAERRGLRANFMPKPFSDAPGSGMHVFQRLTRLEDGGDALRGEGDELSETGRRFVGGQLAHAAALCAVVCPTVNSYKRLAAGHRAPRHATWARLSQASLIRVPAWAPGEEAAVELELRSPDNMANPYLALAVPLACALDGIRQGEEPAAPLDEGLIRYDDDELRRLGVPPLPVSLGDALTALEEDDVVRAALDDYVCDQLLLVKRAEWAEYRRYVSPWEHARYAGE